MMFACGCYLFLSILAACRGASGLKKFYIGGLFPTDIADPDQRATLGYYPLAAAKFAVEHIRESGLLSAHNVSLELASFQTSCRRDEAVYAYLQLMEALQKKLQSCKISLPKLFSILENTWCET